MNHLPFLFIILFSFLTSSIYAGELYVLKNVKVHTEASLVSPVTKLLLGGEKVDVLRIDGDFTEIEDKDKKIGWVSSEFLTDIEHINLVKKDENEGALADKQIPQPQSKTVSNPVTNQANNPESKKNTTQENQANEIQNQKNSDLEKENKQLKVLLNKIRDVLNLSPIANNSIDLANPQTLNNILDFNKLGFDISSPIIVLLIILGTLILGFILGLLWSDFRQRRQHGGFKV